MTTTQKTVGVYLAVILAAVILLAVVVHATQQPDVLPKLWTAPNGTDVR